MQKRLEDSPLSESDKISQQIYSTFFQRVGGETSALSRIKEADGGEKKLLSCGTLGSPTSFHK